MFKEKHQKQIFMVEKENVDSEPIKIKTLYDTDIIMS